MEQEAWEKFGSLMMRRVRDRAIRDADQVVDGKMRGLISDDARRVLSQLDNQQRAAVHELVAEIVDKTLHHLFWTLDQEHDLSIAVRTDAGVVPDLVEISDGLEGDMYDWRSRFSSERYNDNQIDTSNIKWRP